MAYALLQQMLGFNAAFREGQWEAIDQLANQRRRLPVIQRTGWGKSVVCFLATKILRAAGTGPTLLISPLLSWMRNQLLATEQLGVRAATIHSENIKDWGAVEAAVDFLHGDALVPEPRLRWPKPLLEKIRSALPEAVEFGDKGALKTTIPEALREMAFSMSNVVVMVQECRSYLPRQRCPTGEGGSSAKGSRHEGSPSGLPRRKLNEAGMGLDLLTPSAVSW